MPERMPRISLRDEILGGLRRGGTLNIVRRDAPALPVVLGLVAEGLVETELVQLDEQSSALRVRIAPEEETDDNERGVGQ